jgi:hypothetical protein
MNNLVCCLFCKEVKSSRGLHTHVDRSHFKVGNYFAGNNGKYHIISQKAKANKEKKIAEYSINPNFCTNCTSCLPYDKKHQKFCSSRCSAQYGNKNKDYSKFKPGPKKQEKTKYTIICTNCCNNFTSFSLGKEFCSVKCKNKKRVKTLQENNLLTLSEYRRAASFKFNLSDYHTEFDFSLVKEHGWYSAKNRKDNLNGVSRDHMVSVRYGYDNNLPPEHIGHPANCRLVVHNHNVSKGSKNSISYEELLIRIKEWEDKHLHHNILIA